MFSLNIFSEPLQFLISAAAEIKTVSTRGQGPRRTEIERILGPFPFHLSVLVPLSMCFGLLDIFGRSKKK